VSATMEGATAAGGGAMDVVAPTAPAPSNNMVVAVRIRPLSPRELEAGATKCCKVIKGKVRRGGVCDEIGSGLIDLDRPATNSCCCCCCCSCSCSCRCCWCCPQLDPLDGRHW
jgi:hypothetical protein